MPRPIRSKEYFRNVNLIYVAQISAITMLAGVAYFLIDQGNMGKENNELALIFQKVIMVAIPLSLAGGYMVFRFITRNIPVDAPLKFKMQKYFTANLIRSAFLEISGLLLSVAALITAHLLFLTMVPLILVIFILFRPTKAVIGQELNLNPQEIAQLENPKAIISESIE